MKRITVSLTLFVAFVLVAAFAVSMAGPVQNATAAPQAQITPSAANSAVTGETSTLVKFFDGEAITADTQECRDLRGYTTIDLEFVVDQGTTNTTTVQLEHTNGAGAALTTNTDGQVVVSANTADADDLNRFDLYGVYTCVDIDVSNSETITWTVYGLARQ